MLVVSPASLMTTSLYSRNETRSRFDPLVTVAKAAAHLVEALRSSWIRLIGHGMHLFRRRNGQDPQE